MTDPKELGKKGEELAANFLKEKGYVIHSRNYRYNRAEVDIVAEQNGMLVAVEVKTRVSPYLSDPALLVPRSKQKQIILATDDFVKQNFPDKETRFDIIVVVTNEKYTTIDHVVDAFYAMG